MADDWRKIAAAASVEKDSEKLRVLIDSLIEAFKQEQKQVKDTIEKRIAHATQHGLDSSIP
jgi:hypothetical protein